MTTVKDIAIFTLSLGHTPTIDTSWNKSLVESSSKVSQSTTSTESGTTIDPKTLNCGLEQSGTDKGQQMSSAPTAGESTLKSNPPQPPVQPQGDCSLVNGYAWDTRVAYAICLAESGGNPQAFNPSNSDGSNDAGLMEINSIHVQSGLIGDQERFNPQENVRAAYAIYQGGGFSAWSSYVSGKYLQYQ